MVSTSNGSVLTLVGEARVWYKPVKTLPVYKNSLKEQFMQHYSRIGDMGGIVSCLEIILLQ